MSIQLTRQSCQPFRGTRWSYSSDHVSKGMRMHMVIQKFFLRRQVHGITSRKTWCLLYIKVFFTSVTWVVCYQWFPGGDIRTVATKSELLVPPWSLSLILLQFVFIPILMNRHLNTQTCELMLAYQLACFEYSSKQKKLLVTCTNKHRRLNLIQ